MGAISGRLCGVGRVQLKNFERTPPGAPNLERQAKQHESLLNFPQKKKKEIDRSLVFCLNNNLPRGVPLPLPPNLCTTTVLCGGRGGGGG